MPRIEFGRLEEKVDPADLRNLVPISSTYQGIHHVVDGEAVSQNSEALIVNQIAGQNQLLERSVAL